MAASAGSGTYSPERLYAAVETLRGRVRTVQSGWGRDAQARMRQEASWTDRNGPSRTGLNARESLQAETIEDDSGDIVTVLYSDRQSLRGWRSWTDGAPVGAFLELGTRGRNGRGGMRARPVIMPVARSMAPQLLSRLKQVIW